MDRNECSVGSVMGERARKSVPASLGRAQKEVHCEENMEWGLNKGRLALWGRC